MWVLDVIHATTQGVETSYYLHAGEWSLGRKKCHFNFHADSSISRTHAVLRVGALSPEQLRDPLSRPALVLVDQSSRFGSFVNQEQCFGERDLKHGDHITFGAKRTVLRVRYQVFVLVASRISSRNRPRVNDTCQRIGMHLIASESKDATHCIMDPGRIVATVKVLWALVFNQPVVTTPWIYAIAERKSLSEPLPRCENFLPTDDNLPSVASNYLPNPIRKTLFQHHVVVFLSPQSMEELIAAMDGVVIAAHKDAEHDDSLLREIEQHTLSRTVLVVEPHLGSGFSSGAASSDARDPGGASLNASVERRVELFRSMGASFTTVQELAASVIFAKPPISASECSFNSSLAGHNSMSAQIMSFPEHLSLRPAQRDDANDEDMDKSRLMDTTSQANDLNETVSCITDSELIPPQPEARRRPIATATVQPDSVVDESISVKDEPEVPRPSPLPTPYRAQRDVKMLSISREPLSSRPLKLPTRNLPSPAPSGNETESPLAMPRPPQQYDMERDIDPPMARIPLDAGEWVSARDRTVRPKAEAGASYNHDANDADLTKPVVVSCKLVVKKPRATGDTHTATTTQQVANFKRFKKGNGYSSRSTASLFPKQTVVSVTLDAAERDAYNQNLEALEEQERIAEELFAMVEKRRTRKRL